VSGQRASPSGARRSVEIERKFLLSGLPRLPADAEPWRIEQGYLPDPARPGGAGGGGDVTEGRLRRAVGPDGSVRHTHTVKRGLGIERAEIERPLDESEFEAHWPRTAGRRLRKTRYRVAAGGRFWEVDEYPDLGLVLAEIEIESADERVALPEWLAPHVVREVTGEARYTNYRLALARAQERRAMTEGTGTGRITKTDQEWRQQLGDEVYRIARQGGTERAFTGEYWNTKSPGMYTCACCGQELFDSNDKFDSGTGWPSFTRPVHEAAVEERTDRSHGMVRTEVLCSRCAAHLGHVFDDGPGPTGQRYCLNSASLDLKEQDP
jgi:peptide-methionine (R)-S-oxide reductase